MVGTEVASLFAAIGVDMSDFSKGMSKMNDDLSFAEKGFNNLGNAVSTGLKAAAAVGVAAVGVLATGIVAATTKAASMEQGIADIGAMMNLTSADTAALQDHIMDLGLDPKLKVSATEASAAVMALGTAGLDMTEIMGGASKATVLLANATGLKGDSGLASAANIATDVMSQFNIKAEDMDAAVSQIAGTTVASKFTIDDYRLAIAQAGGVAGSVGVDFEDFNAIIAATSPSFASGSDAGTSFKTFLQRLVPTTEEAKDTMIRLGLATADGTSKFFDATGALVSAEEVAGLLDRAFGNLSDAQRINAGSTIFGTDAMRTAFALADGGTTIIAKMKGEIGNVDAEELARKRMDTLAGSWEIFQGVMETLTLGLGNKFLPVSRKVIDWATGLAQTYGPPVIDWFGGLADVVANATDWVLEVAKTGQLFNDKLTALPEPIQRVITFTSNLIDTVKKVVDWVSQTIGKFVGWQDVAAGLATILGVALWPAITAGVAAIGTFIAAATPVIALFVAITAASAALRFAWDSDFLGIRTITGETFTYLTATFGGLFTAIQTFGRQALQEIVAWAAGNETTFENTKKIWEAAKTSFTTAFGDMVAKLKEWGATAWAEFKERFPGAAQALQDAFASISAKFSELWAVISPLIATIVKTVQDMAAKWNDSTLDMGSALGIAKTIIDGIWKVMITLTSTSIGVMIDTLKLVAQLLTGDWAGAWNTAKTMVNDVLEGLKSIVGTAFNTILQVFNVSRDDIHRWRDNVVASVREFAEQTRNNIEQWRSAIVQKFTDVYNNARDKFESIKSAIVTPIREAVDFVADTVESWRHNVSNTFGKMRDSILAFMQGVKASVIEPVKAFITDSSEKITAWKTWIIERWQLMKEAATEKWLAIKMAVTEPITQFVSASMEKINSWKEWLVEKFKAIWEGIQSAFRKASEWVTWGRDLIQGLWDGFKEKWEAFGRWWQTAWDALVRQFKDFFGIHSPSTLFAGFGSDMMAGLQGGISNNIPQVTSAFSSLGNAINSSMTTLTSAVTSTMNSTVQSIVEGVRYGAGLVNMATADVIHQSQVAEAQARAKWEQMKRDAAAVAATIAQTLAPTPGTAVLPWQTGGTPPPPPTGGIPYAPIGSLPPSAPLPPTSPIPQPDVPFDNMFTTQALRDVLGVLDVMTPTQAIIEFGQAIKAALPITALQTEAEKEALSTVAYNPSSYRIDDLLDAVQTLIQAIITRGLSGNVAFDITQAPADYVDNRTELQQLVSFLAAYYT